MRLGLIGAHPAEQPSARWGGSPASQQHEHDESGPHGEGTERADGSPRKDIHPVLNLNLDRLVIGRDPDCDIWLNHTSVGLHHAILTRKGSEFWLQDLDSLTGTLVNNERIGKRLLTDGDSVSVGEYEFRFVDRKRADRTGWERALIAVSADDPAEENVLSHLLEVHPSPPPGETRSSAPEPVQQLSGAESGLHTVESETPVSIPRDSRPQPIDEVPAAASEQAPPVSPAPAPRPIPGDAQPLPVDDAPAATEEEAPLGSIDRASAPQLREDLPAFDEADHQRTTRHQRRTRTAWFLGTAAAAASAALVLATGWWPRHQVDAAFHSEREEAKSNTEVTQERPSDGAGKSNQVTGAHQESESTAFSDTVAARGQAETEATQIPAGAHGESAGEAGVAGTDVSVRGAEAPQVAESQPLPQEAEEKSKVAAQSPGSAHVPRVEASVSDARPPGAKLSNVAADKGNEPLPTRATPVTAAPAAQREAARRADAASLAEDSDQRSEPNRARREQVASRSLVTALLQLQRGEIEASLKVAQEGLTIAPKDAGLQAVRDEAKRRLNERAQRQSRIKLAIDKLLTLADEQRAKSRLTLPPGNNAYETYRRTLALDPANQAARAGLMGIADDYVELARRAAHNGDWRESLELTGRGLSLAPTHAGLLALRAEALRRLSPSRTAAAVPQARSAPPRTTPTGQGKPAKPKKGDPLAQRAIKDVGRFIAGLHAKARQLQKEGRIEECKRLLKTGLGIAPGHPALLQLQKELQQ